MRAIRTVDISRGISSDAEIEADDLTPPFHLALGINACARLLLHDTAAKDPAASVLAYLKKATGMAGVSLFRKKKSAGDEIVFDWPYQTTDSQMERYHWSDKTLATLADGQSVQINTQDTLAGETSGSETHHAFSGLIIPIQVFGKWWGGVCLASDENFLFRDESLLQSLGTVADLLGVFFERQIASRENAESGKLAGALEMAGTVCHKLNQPMQVILGYASMVTSGDISEPEQICEIVQMIEDETRRMGIITKNLMGITKYRTVETPEVGAMCDIDNQTVLS